ncbi:MAG: cytochrome c [Pseudohongiellaceae bacterium]
MSMLKQLVSTVVMTLGLAIGLSTTTHAQTLGTPISEDQLRDFDLIAAPDGSGYPQGSGTAIQGKEVFERRCAACHGMRGEGTSAQTRLVGGDMQSQTSPLRTVGSYWPHASTIFDYVQRAMPADAPKSLSSSEVYQVVAYVLYLNEIIEDSRVLDKTSLVQVEMPNKDGFIDSSQAP